MSLYCKEQSVDISTTVGKCFTQILGAFVEFETDPRREKQMEGIAKVKADGRQTDDHRRLIERK
ncbi:MAG: recombinase family protein [Candidatus Poseidoniales archaeon]